MKKVSKVMEYINKVELAGKVGTIRINTVGERQVANISVATARTFVANNGESIVVTDWHNVVAWESDKNNFQFLDKGSDVHIFGTLRTRKYTSNDGVERHVTEVVADSIDQLINQ